MVRRLQSVPSACVLRHCGVWTHSRTSVAVLLPRPQRSQSAGQDIICSDPTATAGYTVVAGNTNLSRPEGFGVTASCALGYEGEAEVTQCVSSGPYSLAGCTAIECSDAATQVGYTIEAATNLDLSVGPIAADVQCAVGYGPSPVITACSSSGTPYSLSGCDRVFCSSSDCALTQTLRPDAATTLPAVGVAASPEICCESRQGYCSLNHESGANHTELVVAADGTESYRVPCGPGYAEKPDARVIPGDTRSECCNRVFCTASLCLETQRLVQGSELLPQDGVDATPAICCEPVTGMCGGNFDPAEDFDAADCNPWTTYRPDPSEWPYDRGGPLGDARAACCGIPDNNFFMFLGSALLIGCCLGIHKGKIMHATKLEKVEKKVQSQSAKQLQQRRKRNKKKMNSKNRAKAQAEAKAAYGKVMNDQAAAVAAEDFEFAIELKKTRDIIRQDFEDLGMDTPWKTDSGAAGSTLVSVSNPLLMAGQASSSDEDEPKNITVQNPLADDPTAEPVAEPKPANKGKKGKKDKKDKKPSKKDKKSAQTAVEPAAPVPTPAPAPAATDPKDMTDEELKAAVKNSEKMAKDLQKQSIELSEEFAKRAPSQHMKSQASMLSADAFLHVDVRKLAAKAHAAAANAHSLEERHAIANEEASEARVQAAEALAAKERATETAEVHRRALADAQEDAAAKLKAAADAGGQAEVQKEKAVVDAEHLRERVASLQAELTSQREATATAEAAALTAQDAAIEQRTAAKDADAVIEKERQRIELDAEQRIAAAERAQGVETERREKVEADMKELEKELKAVKTADETLRPAKELFDSATGKVAAATEEARKWKATCKEVEGKLKEQTKGIKAAEKLAQKQVNDAKAETQSLQVEIKELKSKMTTAAANAAKQSEESASRTELRLTQRQEAAESASLEAKKFKSELQTNASLATAAAAAAKAKEEDLTSELEQTKAILTKTVQKAADDAATAKAKRVELLDEQAALAKTVEDTIAAAEKAAAEADKLLVETKAAAAIELQAANDLTAKAEAAKAAVDAELQAANDQAAADKAAAEQLLADT
eukprot:COSAG02_NODE_3339_length_6902_cov_59.760694_1_plen_1060_part_10